MKRELLALAFLLATAANAQAPGPQSAPAPQVPPDLQKKVEAYVRKLFAWGPNFQVKVSSPVETNLPSLLQVTVEVGFGDQSDSAIFYVTRDARYILRGDLFDTTVDPFAANRAKIRLDDQPAKGPADAKVVVVEYSDFQCPSCRALHQALRTMIPKYPQVRFVFKDLPIAQIHPWAVTAAIAGRCAFAQSPDAFWKFHDLVFDNQESINPTNAWEKLLEFAGTAGLDPAAMRVCMTQPGPKATVEASVKEAQSLRVANTPTVFVNGRRLVGGDPGLLQQYVNYELAQASQSPATAAPEKTPPRKGPPSR